MLLSWEAVGFVDVRRGGRTQPLVLRCRQNAQRATKLVKALGLPELTQSSLVCELMGNLLARQMGVFTATPCIVSISDEMAQSLQGQGYTVQAGLAVGCDYLENVKGWDAPRTLSAAQMQQALCLFALDMLAQNPDRRPDNPNCGFTQAGELWAYDFEMCFSHCFVPLLGGSSETLARGHLLYPYLRGQEHDWNLLAQHLAGLGDQQWWSTLMYNIPEAWRGHTQRIQSEVLSVVQNLTAWLKQLQRWLA